MNKPRQEDYNSVSFSTLWVSPHTPIFFCLDCGFTMCYGIHETTMKPDVLRNASTYSLKFAEVEMGAHSLVGVKNFVPSKLSGRASLPFYTSS